MTNHDARVEVRCRGNAEQLAQEFQQSLCDELGLDSQSGVQQLDRAGGAVLGAGTVIITIIVTALLKELAKKGIELVANKILAYWTAADTKHTTQFQMSVEIEEKVIARCVISPDDTIEIVQEKTQMWRENFKTAAT